MALRSKYLKEIAAFPDDFDIITDNLPHFGDYSGITVVETPAFNDDDTSCLIDGQGKNLAPLSNKLSEGHTITAYFNKITLKSGVVLAYKD